LGWVNDVAFEIDRLIVAVYSNVGREFAAGWQLPNAHIAILQGVGSALLAHPVSVDSLRATYPYLPPAMLDALLQNNVDEGILTVAGEAMTLTDGIRSEAERQRALFASIPAGWWGERPYLAEVATNAATFGATLAPLTTPSAFAVQVPLVDGSLFRSINALRYWRADAHRAAWAGAGLNVQEAHALNRLWDIDRGVERVGQGEPRPGRTGVAGLTDKGYAENKAITELGVKAREAIEADTDVRTEPIYATLDDAARAAFLTGLRELPIN
jgi:hypothetical protein